MVPGGERRRERAQWSLGERLLWSWRYGTQRLIQQRFPFRSPATIERAQRRRIREMVHYAHRYVPYYREAMGRLGIGPGDIRTAADLARLPLLEREQLQRDPMHFVSEELPVDRYLKLQTGGSSGAPATIMRGPVRADQLGHHERGRAVERKLTGKRWGARMLDIASPLAPAATLRRRFADRLLAPSFLTTSRVDLSLHDPPSKVLAVMDEFRPDLVLSHGSYLEFLFHDAYRRGNDFHHPAVVVYSADGMSEPMRRLFAEELGIEVLTYYSAVEAPAIGFECEEHRGLHLNCDIYPVRIVGEDGEELPDGESGQVVVSNLVFRGTVLLNYRLGDVAAKLPGPCPCGRSLPLLSFLEGRVGDWITTPDGRRVHPQLVRIQFTEEEDVWRYQVVQRTPTRLAIKVVTAPACDRRELATRLATKFAGLFGDGLTIEVSFVDEIPRTARGKVRTVIALADSHGVAP
jgi:phenylacetate-coenzyme A ligase PaaK-like adenylate-forming protein